MKKTIHSHHAQLITQALREMRKKAGLTQRDLSQQIGKPHSFIAKCELGERRVDLVEWYWLCEACGADTHAETKKLLNAFAKG